MPNCSRCGFKLPEGALFCPNCGSPVRKVEEKQIAPSESITRPITLGLLGSFLSLTISSLMSFANIQLYFVPHFLASLIVIYFSGTRGLKDAAIVSMVTYLFTDAIIAGMILGSLYVANQSLASLYMDYGVPTLLDVIMYLISPVTAILTAYIGSKIAPKRRETIAYIREEGYGPPLFHGVENLEDGAFKRFK
jgi:hypothetical protein